MTTDSPSLAASDPAADMPSSFELRKSLTEMSFQDLEAGLVSPFVKAARPDDTGLGKKASVGGSEAARKDSGDTATVSPKCPFGYDSNNFKLGPLSCMICQALLFDSTKCIPCSHLFCKHFFFTAMFFVYGRLLSQPLVNTVTSDKFLYQFVSSLVKYHMAICYFLYIAGFMWFILTLKKKMYKYQFGQYAWTHMILIVVFTQSSFTVANIFEGIFWFLLPASLIVINDIFAYIFGFFFGRTPLIKLSPKKTWEGFIGASVTTIISAFVLANILGRFHWLTCPRKDLSTGWLQCDPGPLFKPENYILPGWISQWFPWKEISVLPVQWHALCFGLFASIIAPFGGFFASGFKRAFKIKDFGDSIPGHGGITDRMDCQMVMAVFAYIYHQSFVVRQGISVEMILDQILTNLTFEEQQSLVMKLGQILQERLEHS